MKRLSEYKAKTALADTPKNPSRENVMKTKSLSCTPENPSEALMPSPEPMESEPGMLSRDPKKEMEVIFSNYLASDPNFALNRQTRELEIRFQGINGAPLTKVDYNSVIQHLYAAGFDTSNPNGIHILRVIPEYIDNAGVTKMSNIRAEITGIDLIQEYCKTNSIQHLLNLPSTISASSG
jgi:hypothetical protein